MRQPVTRKCAGDFTRDVKHEGIGRTRSFTFPAAEPQDEHKYLYNGHGLVRRGCERARLAIGPCNSHRPASRGVTPG